MSPCAHFHLIENVTPAADLHRLDLSFSFGGGRHHLYWQGIFMLALAVRLPSEDRSGRHVRRYHRRRVAFRRSDGLRDLIRFTLMRLRWRHWNSCSRGRSALLLDNVCQLVRKQPLSRARVWRILSGSKDHVTSDRVCKRFNKLCRFSCPRIGMHPDTAEVVPEARLHEGARRRVERLAGRA